MKPARNAPSYCTSSVPSLVSLHHLIYNLSLTSTSRKHLHLSPLPPLAGFPLSCILSNHVSFLQKNKMGGADCHNVRYKAYYSFYPSSRAST